MATKKKKKAAAKPATKKTPKKKTAKKKAPKAKPKARAKAKAASKPKLAEVPLDSPVVMAPPTPRQLAREARQAQDPAERDRLAKKAQAMKEREERRQAANARKVAPLAVAGSVSSIEDARKRREELERMGKDEGDYPIPMPDLAKYQLLHLTARRKELVDSIRKPLIEAAQKELDDRLAAIRQEIQVLVQDKINKAVEDNATRKAIEVERAGIINSLIDEYTPQLKPGYAVSTVDEDAATLTASYNPLQVGMKLDAPAK